MRIDRINTTNFKGVHILVTEKKIFEYPDVPFCAVEFHNIANEILDEYIEDTLKQRMQIRFETKVGVKIFHALESPGYETVKARLYEYGRNDYSVNWLARNSNTNLTEPKNPNYHTFYVLTGEEKEQTRKAYNYFNTKKMQLQAFKTYKKCEDPVLNTLRRTAKLAEILDKKFHEIIDNKSATVWLVKTKEDLENTIRNIFELDG